MIDNNSKLTIGLFFTYGVSLRLWEERGLLKREIALYNRLAKKLHSIFFFTYGDRSDIKYSSLLAPNIFIVTKPHGLSNKIYSLLLPFIHYKILKKCDIFKTNQMDGAWTAVISKLLFNKKLLIRTGYHWSSTLLQLYGRNIVYWRARIVELIAYYFADTAVVTSENIRKKIVAGRQVRQAVVMPNYVDVGLFCPFVCAKRKNEVCFVGRISREKNLLMLVDALEGTGISATIIGDGNEKKVIASYAKKKNVNLKFCGIMPNDSLPRFLNQFQIFILPSLFEGHPKALIEAMACGLCVIGTNVGGINDVIIHDFNGLLCDLNPLSLRTAVIAATQNVTLRKRLSENARAFAVSKYSIDMAVNKECGVYSSLSGQHL